MATFPTGRKIIYTREEEVTPANLCDILYDAIPTFHANRADIEFLFSFYKGEQPIIHREKKIRPDIKNVVIENHAYAIVSFFAGYIFGDPIQYVRRGAVTSEDTSGSDADKTSLNVGILNEFMFSEDKPSFDKELGDWMLICGMGYRAVLPDKRLGLTEDEAPFEIATLDPRETFIIRSNRFSRKPVMACQVISLPKEKEPLYVVWTENRYYEVFNKKIVKNEPHFLGGIPIIEYYLNNERMGVFEPVISLLDALNNVQSNRIDGIEQFIQSFMKFLNTDIDKEGLEELRELGAIKVRSEPGMPADVEIVTAELNQDQSQTLVDCLTDRIMILCGMPDRGNNKHVRGDTGQAVMLRDGWTEAETKAKSIEMSFKRSEKAFLKLVLNITYRKRRIELKLSDIDIKFTRNRTDNLLVKTQGLQNMLEAGVHPQIAIAHSTLFSDPEQVYLDSQPYLEKWLNVDAGDHTNQMPSAGRVRAYETPDIR